MVNLLGINRRKSLGAKTRQNHNPKREKFISLTSSKLKINPVKRMKIQATVWENIFANHISDKG